MAALGPAFLAFSIHSAHAARLSAPHCHLARVLLTARQIRCRLPLAPRSHPRHMAPRSAVRPAQELLEVSTPVMGYGPHRGCIHRRHGTRSTTGGTTSPIDGGPGKPLEDSLSWRSHGRWVPLRSVFFMHDVNRSPQECPLLHVDWRSHIADPIFLRIVT
jgi:hypothetical protein